MAKVITKKITPKKVKRKSFMLRVCIFAFAVYAVVSLVSMQINLADRRRQLSQLEQRVETQRLANKELERQLAQGMDEEYVERIARERLGFIAPDEIVYIDVSGS